MNKLKHMLAIITALAVFAVPMCAGAEVSDEELEAALAQLEETQSMPEQDEPDPFAPDDNGWPQDEDESSDPDIAAEFNGGAVSVEEARSEYGAIATYYFGLGMSEDEFSDDLKQTVLQTLAENKVLRAKAKELGLDQFTAEQRAAIEAQAAADYEENVTYYTDLWYDETKTAEQNRAETIEYLNETGASYEDVLKQRENDAIREALLEYVGKDVSVEEDQLRTYYDDQVIIDEVNYSSNFTEYEADADAGRVIAWNPEGVRRVDTILIRFNNDQSERYMNILAEIAADGSDHQDELDALFAELEPTAAEAAAKLASGADFYEVQKEYSVLHEGGTYVSDRSTECGDKFRDAAMGLNSIGDVSDPVVSDWGIVIIRYAGDVVGGATPYDDIREDLRESYLMQARQLAYSEAVEKWIEEADIRYYPDRI